MNTRCKRIGQISRGAHPAGRSTGAGTQSRLTTAMVLPRLKSWMALFTATAVALAGCSTTPKVQTEARASGDLSNFKTFALLPLPTSVPGADPGLMSRVAEPARRAAIEGFTAKGLREVELAQADLAVNLRGEALPKVEATELGYTTFPTSHIAYRVPVPGAGSTVRNYEERKLVVEVFDNRTKSLAWVGSIQRESQGPVAIEILQESIRAVIAKFPSTR